MKLEVTPCWQLRDDAAVQPLPIDRRLPGLLAAIDASGSLAAAARRLALPYRSAWALLEDVQRRLGAPLVVLTRGRGATLTPLARRWLAADAAAAAQLARSIASLEAGPSREAPPAARPLKVAASHDLALAQLRDRWRLAYAIALSFQGSTESLDAYRAGSVDLAGFHYATGSRSRSDTLLARLRADRDVLIRFIKRSQGLILPRGNPRRVRTLADIAAKRLTFVNRQPGSGTRLLLDRLLRDGGIEAASVPGYSNEEFTHAAVAATVAAGRAQAAFGIEAAAAQFGLAFVPLVDEYYRFACRRQAADAQSIVAFRELLASAATRAVVAPLAGYRLDAPGRLAAVRAASA